MREHWDINPRFSVLAFSGERLGTRWVDGMFTRLEGTIRIDPSSPDGGTVSVIVPVRRLVAGSPELNTPLRVFEYLDAQKSPRLPVEFTVGRCLSGNTHSGRAEWVVRDRTLRADLEIDVMFEAQRFSPVTAATGDQESAGRHVELKTHAWFPGDLEKPSSGLSRTCQLSIILSIIGTRASAEGSDGQSRIRSLTASS